jgi:hypoxanthine phosphoribosyltransferase
MSSRVLRVSESEITRRVSEIAEKISLDYRGRELVVVGVLKGAFIFLADLVRKLTIPVVLDFIQVASYGASMTSSGTISLKLPISMDVKGKHVLLVEDIVDTGGTIRFLLDHILSLGASSVAVCAMIDKPERRKVEVPVHYVCLRVPEGFLVGYGLDHAERYRELPGIYELITDASGENHPE